MSIWSRLQARGLPTDRKILETIYDQYYDTFVAFDSSTDSNPRRNKILVPIDIKRIADELQVDQDIVFGRLYYDLEERYHYDRSDGLRVAFFTLEAAGDRHCVNFPYMVSVLARLKDDEWRFRVATILAGASLGISLVSLFISVFVH